MGRHPKSASQLTGNHMSVTEKKRLEALEKDTVGSSDRLEKGLEGLAPHEKRQLNNKEAKDNYHVIAQEASKVSALGNIHISTIIELANEIAWLKEYKKAIKTHGTVMFVGEKPVPNPAVKMRQDSLKSINAMKSQLGLGAVDIVNLARQKAESNGKDELTKLFGAEWEE